MATEIKIKNIPTGYQSIISNGKHTIIESGTVQTILLDQNKEGIVGDIHLTFTNDHPVGLFHAQRPAEHGQPNAPRGRGDDHAQGDGQGAGAAVPIRRGAGRRHPSLPA